MSGEGVGCVQSGKGRVMGKNGGNSVMKRSDEDGIGLEELNLKAVSNLQSKVACCY